MRVLITRSQAALLSLCAILLALLIYELTAPLTLLEPPQIRLHRLEMAIAPPQLFMAPPLANFSVIDDRPVFNPLRQPVKGVQTPGETAAGAAPPKFALVGIIVDGQNKLAMIKMPGAAFATSVAIGGDVAGWQVSQIEADGIVLHSGSSDYTIKLNSNRDNATPVAGDQPQQK